MSDVDAARRAVLREASEGANVAFQATVDALIAAVRAEPCVLDAQQLRDAIRLHAAEHKTHSRTHVREQCTDAILMQYARLTEAER